MQRGTPCHPGGTQRSAADTEYCWGGTRKQKCLKHNAQAISSQSKGEKLKFWLNVDFQHSLNGKYYPNKYINSDAFS